jgi:hypothetical protein
MKNLNLLEEYFVKLHKVFGISNLSYINQRLELDEENLRQTVFLSEAFNDEFDNLINHCGLIYNEVNKGFYLRIRKDVNNDYLVTLV